MLFQEKISLLINRIWHYICIPCVKVSTIAGLDWTAGLDCLTWPNCHKIWSAICLKTVDAFWVNGSLFHRVIKLLHRAIKSLHRVIKTFTSSDKIIVLSNEIITSSDEIVTSSNKLLHRVISFTTSDKIIASSNQFYIEQ